MSRVDLAARVGLSEVEVRSIERGERRATAREVWFLSEALDAKLSDFLREVSEEKPDC